MAHRLALAAFLCFLLSMSSAAQDIEMDGPKASFPR